MGTSGCCSGGAGSARGPAGGASSCLWTWAPIPTGPEAELRVEVKVEAAVWKRLQAHQPNASRRPPGDAFGHEGSAYALPLAAPRHRQRAEPGERAMGDREERADQRSAVGRHEAALGVHL